MEATPDIILQITLFSIGMVILSNLFAKKFGTSTSQQLELQEKMQQFQVRMQEAQHSPQELQRLQVEMMGYMNQMLKKQLLPMLVRTLIFFGFFGLLALLYKEYDEIFPFNILFFGKGYFALYFVVSLCFSLVVGLIKMIVRKINPKAQPQEKPLDALRALQNNLLIGQMGQNPYRNPMSTDINAGMLMDQNNNDASIPKPTKAWKQKLNQTNDSSNSNENH